MTILGYLAIRSVIPQWGEDPSRVTVDEIVGMWVTILCIPGLDLRWWIGAFALFRFFDILKPLGIRYFDRLRGARGVLLDDIVAGLYAGVTIRILHDVVCS
jgi:phosphatidylglycerophosphatase A